MPVLPPQSLEPRKSLCLLVRAYSGSNQPIKDLCPVEIRSVGGLWSVGDELQQLGPILLHVNSQSYLVVQGTKSTERQYFLSRNAGHTVCLWGKHGEKKGC